MDSTVLTSKPEKKMTKTITANIPAKTIKLSSGSRKVDARIETLTQDDDGHWTIAFNGAAEKISEAEAIDVCRKASNWEAIRREYFQMVGFHN